MAVVAVLGALLLIMAVQSMAAQDHAVLTVFVGTAQLERAGSSGYQAAHSGDLLVSGDRVRTGAGAKASLTFPDGSVSRLDAGTDLQVEGLSRATGGGEATRLRQSAGQTWYTVVRLVGGASFRVDAPNNSTAEVRGTEFSIRISGSGSSPLVTAQVWAGEVAASAAGRTLVLVAGQSTTIAAGSPPTPAVALGLADRQDPWTVFNLGLDALDGGTVTTIDGGTMSTGDSTQPAVGAEAAAGDDLQFVLAWPGSTFRLTVLAPDGSTYAAPTSSQPPLSVTVSGASAGNWSYAVADLESQPGEQWYLFVARRRAPAGSPAPPSGLAGSGGPATPAVVTTSTATPAPTEAGSTTPTSTSSTPSSGETSTPEPGSSLTPIATPPPGTPTPAPTPTPRPTPTPVPPPAISIGPTALPTGVTGLEWSAHVSASGGTSPYRWTIAGAPSWLTLNARSGELDGKPAAAGNYPFTVTVIDATGASASRRYLLTVV